MLLTKNEAREKWCPHVRIARRDTYLDGNSPLEREAVIGGCNTDALGRNRVPASCRCIADQCAMWRWGTTLWRDPNAPAGILQIPKHVRADVGYCGLAGRPEVAS